MNLKILSVDTSAKTVSVAVYNENKIDEILLNKDLTHSETLAPLIEQLLEKNNLSFNDFDYLATNIGPGSYTGIRIGVSTIKAIASVNNIPCIGVSTLETMPYNFSFDKEVYVCSLIDARNRRFFNSLFHIKDGNVIRLCDDRAIEDSLICDDIKDFSNVILAGDGAEKFYNDNSTILSNSTLPEFDIRIQKASSIIKLALECIKENRNIYSYTDLIPLYLKPTKAEIDLINKGE